MQGAEVKDNVEKIEFNPAIHEVDNTYIEDKKGLSYYTYLFVKRIFDIVGSLIGIAILIPVTIAVWIARIVLKENDGPLFYEQLRYGKNGKMFRLYKFRSMCMNADEKLEKYLKENEDKEDVRYYKKYKKFKEDPRVTKLGKFLRKTSIDELPQVINILFGQMSFIGPRPYLSREKEDIGSVFNEIVSVKPGLTGYWQVRGRSNATFEDRIKLDLYYIEHQSLKLDAKIFFKTFKAVLKHDGAK